MSKGVQMVLGAHPSESPAKEAHGKDAMDRSVSPRTSLPDEIPELARASILLMEEEVSTGRVTSPRSRRGREQGGCPPQPCLCHLHHGPGCLPQCPRMNPVKLTPSPKDMVGISHRGARRLNSPCHNIAVKNLFWGCLGGSFG